MNRDSFWDIITKGFSEAVTPFEDGSSASTGESEGYRTLFRDDAEGKGMMFPPRSILRMRVNKGKMLLSEIRFMSKSHHHEKFQTWVGIMLGQPSMSKKFQDLGKLRAITQARKAAVERDPQDLEFLLSRWNTETHSLVAAWGEFGPTLEDVLVLTSLPIFGDTQVTHFKLTDRENRERHEALTTFLQKTKYGAAKKSTFLTWAAYFVDRPGSKSAYQLKAFLAYWLNYFVFPSPPEDGVPVRFSDGSVACPREEATPGSMVLGCVVRPLG